jgi:uncharacterized protein (TIGR00369 family)
MLIEPNPTNICFGCGGGNARGMKLTFEQDDVARKIIGRFRLGAEYQGAFGIIHGGVIAVVLDEVMGKVCRFRAVRAVTAEMNVEYLKPVFVDANLVVEGYEKEMEGRNLHLVGEIKDATSGKLLARSRGRFVMLNRAPQAQPGDAQDGTAKQVSST